MVRTRVQLTANQIRALKQLSSASGRSIADLVRQGVDHLLALQSAVTREDRVQRAMRMAGKFRSGKTHVSTRHDESLVEAYHSRLR
jgi:hypothetical protein